jgi:CHAD domain-containing protein
LLRLVRFAVRDSFFTAENKSFRDAGRPLAEVRDAKVLLDALEALKAHVGEEREAAFAAAQKRLAKQRDDAQASALLAGGAWAATEQAIHLSLARLNKRSWRRISNNPKKLRKGLRAVYRRGRQALQRAQADPLVENLHEWRKQVKHLRHSLEILTPVSPEVFGQLARQANELGELLGRDHDLAVLRCTLHADDNGVVAGVLEPLIDGQREQLQAEAMDRGIHLYRLTAKKLTRGLTAKLESRRQESAAAND